MGTNTIRRRLFSSAAAAIVIGCVQLSAGRAPEGFVAGQSGTPARIVLDEDAVADFRRRAEQYMKLHDKIQKKGTRQTPAMDIGENLVSRQALAMRIRFARHDARPGDLFTPRIAMALRRAIDPELRGSAALNVRESIRDDAPVTFVLVVNGDYPDGASRSTMPPILLKILPPLPKGLDYRIVGTHLLLMDLDANIVVDYMLDVMCKTC
jgi:hypothetical protein